MDEIHDVVMEILPLKDQRWVDPNKILKMTNRLGLDDVEAKIYFLRELLAIVRKLPLAIYNDPQDRLRLIDALQSSLDKAIEEEEELLEED